MKTFLATLLVLSLSAPGHAGPTEDAILAAMKLSENPNYSWSTSVTDDASTYYTEGKTAGDGWTWLRLPVTTPLARRLGREAGKEIEALFFKSRDAFVVQTEKGWKTLGDLPRQHPDWVDNGDMWVMPATAMPGGSIYGGNDPFMSSFPTMLIHVPPPSGEDEKRTRSMAQFALSHPHEDLAVIVSSHTALKVEGDTITGALSDVGAQLLLVREGLQEIEPLVAAGIFKLRLANKRVEELVVRLEGIVRIDGKRIHVHQTSETRIKDVGKTALEIPVEARQKLELPPLSANVP